MRLWLVCCWLACALTFIPAAAQERLRIAIEGAFPPFSAVDGAGELVGFDVDIARALCEEMTVECTLVQQDWDGIIPGLLARKYDAIIASMSITEERKKSVAFTDKYYQTPARFLVPKDSNLEISPPGLAGKTIGVQRATIWDRYISAQYPDADIKRYASQDEIYLDMAAGRVDATFVDALAARGGFLNTPKGADYTFKGPTITDPKWVGEGIGSALRKGDDPLRQRFNDAIANLRADGTYDAIRSRYFDFDIYGD
ncbi:MAG: ABC transporter substrate-binding protein [Candidatus Competibacterales bacterium]